MHRCMRTTRKGTRCRLPAIDGLDICKTHYDADHTHLKCGNKFGYVYLFDTGISQDGSRVYKIGKTMNPVTREKEFRQCNPAGKMLHAAFIGTGAAALEHKLHKKYHDLNIERELYSLSPINLANVLSDLNKATVAMP